VASRHEFEPSPLIRHGRQRSRSPIFSLLRWLGAALAVVLVSALSLAAITAQQFTSNVKTVELVGQTAGPPPEIGAYEGGFNVLVVGSDVCEDGSGCNGRGSSELNDVTMLLHVSADQTNAVAVSIPRDMVVPIPSCPRQDGKGSNGAMSGQPINVSLFYGGLPCTVLTVQALTGLPIQFAMEVKFSGIVNITNAIGGVPVCVDGPIDDRYSGFSVPAAGTYNLSGEQALDFLRTRHGVGDASDLARISGQQLFLSSMVKKLKAPDGALHNPVDLYKIASAVSQNTIVSSNLKNLNVLVALANVLKNLDLSQVVFVQYPGVTGQGGIYAGKVAPVPSLANAMLAKIKADQSFLPGKTGLGSKADAAAPTEPSPSTSVPATTATPTQAPEVITGLRGQSAAEQTCAAHR